MQRSVTFEARHPQISVCMPKKWGNTHLCTSKVTPGGAFWKISLARKRGKPPPFFKVANFKQNPMTSHFAETHPPSTCWSQHAQQRARRARSRWCTVLQHEAYNIYLRIHLRRNPRGKRPAEEQDHFGADWCLRRKMVVQGNAHTTTLMFVLAPMPFLVKPLNTLRFTSLFDGWITVIGAVSAPPLIHLLNR